MYDTIEDWIPEQPEQQEQQSIIAEKAASQPETRSRKRKRQKGYLSPDSSDSEKKTTKTVTNRQAMSNQLLNPRAKRRAEDDFEIDPLLDNHNEQQEEDGEATREEDADETPKRRPGTIFPAPAPSRSGSITTTSSRESRGSSPSKRNRRVPQVMLATAIDLAFFDGSEPLPLNQMVVKLERLDSDRQFVWSELLEPLLALSQNDPRFRKLARPVWFTRSMSTNTGMPNDGDNDILSGHFQNPAPSIQALTRIMNNARQCEDELDAEAAWNCEVHQPLFDLALDGYQENLRASNCTAATIRPEYSTYTTPSNSSNYNTKKVDFCITLRRRADARIAALVRDGVAINHTVYEPYMQNPIAISIETKSRKPDREEALLQLGTWLSAQFQCLRHLVVARYANLAAGRDAWRAALEELAFLPGVMVLQHSWHLVAATRPDPDTEANSQQQQPRVKLWRTLEMGNTQTPEGICQLIVSLRILLHWAQNTYWPWFEKWVLRQVERSR